MYLIYLAWNLDLFSILVLHCIFEYINMDFVFVNLSSSSVNIWLPQRMQIVLGEQFSVHVLIILEIKQDSNAETHCFSSSSWWAQQFNPGWKLRQPPHTQLSFSQAKLRRVADIEIFLSSEATFPYQYFIGFFERFFTEHSRGILRSMQISSVRKSTKLLNLHVDELFWGLG